MATGTTMTKERRIGSHAAEVRTTAGGDLPGGEQAASVLHPDSRSRHTTTLDAKVGSTITALLLVDGRPCVFHPAVIKGVHVALFLTVY
jgi:hypothetical protein